MRVERGKYLHEENLILREESGCIRDLGRNKERGCVADDKMMTKGRRVDAAL